MMNLVEPSKDDDSRGEGVAVGSSKLTTSEKQMRRRHLLLTYNASTGFTRLKKTHKTSTRFEPEHKQPMLHTKSGKEDESSGDNMGSNKLTRSKNQMRRRQPVPTYNASTLFTRLENTQD
jgi:hypothetical protein